MAFADPQTVTIAGVATPLARTSVGNNTSTYKNADGTVTLTASSAYGKRTRRTVRLEHNKVAADPFTTGASTKVSMTSYLVIDVPVNGYSVAQQKEIVDALTAYLTASAGASVTKVLGGEN